MEYERIEKSFSPQGGGFSPKKLRAMLLGVEKKRKEDEEYEEMESKSSLRSHANAGVGVGIDARGSSIVEECKDVDVVSSISGSSSSVETGSSHRSLDSHFGGSMVRLPEEDSCDSESVASNFEFHRERAPPPTRSGAAVVPPFSKPAPSKWDDAQKWIASPTTNRPSRAGGAQPRKVEKTGFGGGRPSATKVVMEATEDVDTKRIDLAQDKREIVWQKAANWVPDPYPDVDSCAKAALAAENVLADSAVTFSRHDSSTSLQSSTTFISPPTTVRSVSMRDMGTEMTPIASQEPSRTGTPVRATSPDCSRPSTPQQTSLSRNAVGTMANHGDLSNAELSEKELQMKTRREIVLLGTQLGKTNITAWASKHEEEKDASLSFKTLQVDQTAQSVTEISAAAWEEAEKAKHVARLKREEIKIQAWEDHQKAKIEAEMRKTEVEVERMRARAQDKLMNHLASARHQAEEKRAVAESKRNKAAARTAEQADYIRKTGRVPSSLSCWGWCS